MPEPDEILRVTPQRLNPADEHVPGVPGFNPYNAQPLSPGVENVLAGLGCLLRGEVLNGGVILGGEIRPRVQQWRQQRAERRAATPKAPPAPRVQRRAAPAPYGRPASAIGAPPTLAPALAPAPTKSTRSHILTHVLAGLAGAAVVGTVAAVVVHARQSEPPDAPRRRRRRRRGRRRSRGHATHA